MGSTLVRDGYIDAFAVGIGAVLAAGVKTPPVFFGVQETNIHAMTSGR
jgi:hypothetical protein